MMIRARRVLKKLSVLSLSLVIATVPTMSVRADNVGAVPLMYLNDVDLASGEMTDKTEQTLMDNYWVDLEKRTVVNASKVISEDNKDAFGLFPKYITHVDKTALKDIAFHGIDLNATINNFPNTGIRSNGHTLEFVYYWSFYQDNQNSRPDKLPKDKWRNPYDFKQSEILTSYETADPDNKLAIYSDLYAKGSDSNAVGEYSRGSEIPLEFSLNASWFSRYLNGLTLEFLGGGQTNENNVRERANQYVKYDSELVFTLDIPTGVTLASPSAEVEGLDGFKATTSERDGKLIIKINKDKNNTRRWGELLKKISEIDTSNIRVSISGVKVADDASIQNPITMKATSAGFFDFAMSETENFYSFSKDHKDDAANRYYAFFAAKQSDAGRDAGADVSKPNLISYTFKVKKPASKTVTFINDSKTYASVKVETGKTIDNDALADQSMPRNPSKDGYTFVGWNTKEDGTGTTFTGKTTVNRDITVYAIYEKNIVPRPRPDRPYTPDTPDPGRVDGDDRIETAINISRKYYDKANTVIVVRHDLFPDSMTASVLARLKDAPILLNPTAKLDPRVGKEITRLGAKEVIIVGGENSVSEKVREELKPYDADKNVERISGHDRYGTSEMVARRVVGITGKKNIGVVASGEVFPDALAVGTFASRDGYPILLVKKNAVPVQITRAIKDLDINKTYIAGGVNTISKSTEAKLPSVIERMAGQTRYDTALAIARSKFANSKEAFIASGEEFADALVISPVSGKYDRPTLLVSRNANANKAVKKYIKDSKLTSITAIGGQRYVPNSVLVDLVK